MSDTKSGFTDAERAAMKQRAEELKATKGVKGSAKRAREYEQCLAAIDEMTGSDRLIAERLHAIVAEIAPQLDVKTMYGFPTYYHRDGKNVVFFQPAAKWGSRYATINFDEGAQLDDSELWPISYAVIDWNDDVEQRVRALVQAAVE